MSDKRDLVRITHPDKGELLVDPNNQDFVRTAADRGWSFPGYKLITHPEKGYKLVDEANDDLLNTARERGWQVPSERVPGSIASLDTASNPGEMLEDVPANPGPASTPQEAALLSALQSPVSGSMEDALTTRKREEAQAAAEKAAHDQYVKDNYGGSEALGSVVTGLQGVSRYSGGDLLREGLDKYVETPVQTALQKGASLLDAAEAALPADRQGNTWHPNYRAEMDKAIKDWDFFQSKDKVAQNKEQFPISSATGEVIGVAAPAVLTGGASLAPTDAISRLAGVAGTVAEAKTGSQAIGEVARLAAEGAGFGVLTELDNAYLNDDYEDIAQKTIAGAGLGAVLNVAGGKAVEALGLFGGALGETFGPSVRRVFGKRAQSVLEGKADDVAKELLDERTSADTVFAPPDLEPTIQPPYYAPTERASAPSMRPTPSTLPVPEVPEVKPDGIMDPDYGFMRFGHWDDDQLTTILEDEVGRKGVKQLKKIYEGKETLDPATENEFRQDIYLSSYKQLESIRKTLDDVENGIGIPAKKNFLDNYSEQVVPPPPRELSEFQPQSDFPSVPPEYQQEFNNRFASALANNDNSFGPFQTGSGAVRAIRNQVGLSDDWIEAMLANKSNIDEGGAAALGRLRRKFEGVIQNVFEKSDQDVNTVGRVYYAADRLKNALGTVAETVKNKNVKEILREKYDVLKTYLENEAIWPKDLTDMQKQVNAFWTAHLRAGGHEVLGRFWIEGSEAASDKFENLLVPSPKALGTFLANIGSDATEIPFESALKTYLDAVVADTRMRAKAWGSPEIQAKADELAKQIQLFEWNVTKAKVLNLARANKTEESRGLLNRMTRGIINLGAKGTTAFALGNPLAAAVVPNIMETAAKKSIPVQKKGGRLVELAKAGRARLNEGAEAKGLTFSAVRDWGNKANERLKSAVSGFVDDVTRKAERVAPPSSETKQALQRGLGKALYDLYSDDPDGGPQRMLDQAAEFDSRLIPATAAQINLQRQYVTNILQTYSQPHQKDQALEAVHAALDPMSALTRVSNGTATPETRDALQSVWPVIWNQYVRGVTEKSTDLTYDQKVSASKRLGVPLVPELADDFYKRLHLTIDTTTGQQQGGKAPDVAEQYK